MNEQIEKDTKEIIDSFISEGYERIEDAENQISHIGLENCLEVVNTVFRLFHSLKGSAGYLNFDNIKRLTHEAETLLEIFRKESINPDQAQTDLLFQTIDVLRQMIAHVQNNMNDKGTEEISQNIVVKIKECINDIECGSHETGQSPEPSDNGRLVTKEMIEKYISETCELLDRSENEALILEKESENQPAIQEIFRCIHTIKGNSGFLGFTVVEKVCIELETLLDDVRTGKITVNNAIVTNILKIVDIIRKEIKHSQNGNDGKAENTESIEYKPLGEILVDIGAVKVEVVEKALETQDKPIGEMLIESGHVKPEDVEKALEIQKNTYGNGQQEIQRKEIRVNTAKLDRLFDLVGELITAEAMVFNSPDIQGIRLDNFNKTASALSKISRELQETTMMIRMIPLDGLFNKLTRLVRDLSGKFGKKIDLKMSGQETEMDKNVIEQISDPLVHILRNAIDHGIELPLERANNGKDQTGTIKLSAKYEGSDIWLSVKDDGRGLNKEKIIRKAVEKGLLREPLPDLADDEVWQFIFEPGLSTAEQVSEVSGRGVGMDVVRKNMEKIRGKIEIKSEAGKGSEFILKIPLTMAIIDGITLKTGDNYYSIPVIDILEFFKAKDEMLIKMENGREVVNLRGDIIPLIRLYEVFKLKSKYDKVTDGIMVVVKNEARKACIFIDEIIGTQQLVIKSISDFLGTIDGISGCSILGDGNVSFILDTSSFINRWVE